MEYKVGDKVSLVIGKPNNFGINVFIDENQDAMLYHNEIFKPLEFGQIIDGYIKNIREDGKIDVSLQPQGFRNVIETNIAFILEKLTTENGCIKLTDKSEPHQIEQKLNMSKKAFKAAIGQLYKQQIITLEEDGIYLIK